MALNKPLSKLCLDGLYKYGEGIVRHILKSNGEERQRLQFKHQCLINIFKLWNLSSSIERFKAGNVKWEVRVQDFQNTEYSTITLSFQTSMEYERFKAFLRHLICNWFRDVKVQKLHAGNLSFVVTYPVPVLLHIYPQSYAPCDKHARLSTSKSSDVETVLKVLQNILTKDFIFSCTLNESERKEKIEGKPRFTHPHYKYDTLPDLLLNQLTEAYVSVPKAGHSLYCPDHFDSDGSQTEMINILMAQNSEMRRTIQEMNYGVAMQNREYQLGYEKYLSEMRRLQNCIKEKDAELYATMLDLGRASVELQRLQNKKPQRSNSFFDTTYNSHTASTQTIGASSPSSATRSEVNGSEAMGRRGAPFESSIQESLNDRANLANMHTLGVEGSIYNNYKLLLLRIAHNLLTEDVTKLKLWVAAQFGVDASLNVNDILVDLDRKGVISVTDLSRLRKFFEDNALRYDFVCLIDSFLLGDYEQLKKPSSSSTFRRQSSLPDRWSSQRTSVVSDEDSAETSQDLAGDSFQRVLQRRFLRAPRSRDVGLTPLAQASSSSAQTGLVSFTTNSREQRPSDSQGAEDGARLENEVQTSAGNVPIRGDDTNDTSRNTEQEGNRQALSKPQISDSSNIMPERHEWLCTHYKRHCYVQFECCDQFWPCHRCHNNQSSCGRKKLKSRDTKRIKCAACGEEQEFAHRCSRCNLQFARYFCALCKHLTGTDDSPYHCDKCGICRIHGDRSFHCDVCGVCLDVQLRGNHRCREGSAHDGCCICLEDAFTGCQILPCSHKVHKDCAAQMIKSGITRCPICRESFAHKLEKKSSKKFGKK